MLPEMLPDLGIDLLFRQADIIDQLRRIGGHMGKLIAVVLAIVPHGKETLRVKPLGDAAVAGLGRLLDVLGYGVVEVGHA